MWRRWVAHPSPAVRGCGTAATQGGSIHSQEEWIQASKPTAHPVMYTHSFQLLLKRATLHDKRYRKLEF